MGEQEDKKLDAFLKTAIKDLTHEHVSSDFNKKLFQRISQIDSQKLVHTPLIPKKVWFLLALLLIGFLAFGFIVEPSNDFWLFSIKYNTIGNLDFLNLGIKDLKWNSTSYAMAGFVIFILFQILFLKQYFSKHKVII